MKTILHLFIALAVLQIAASTQNPYGSPSNPASYPVQHNPDGSIPNEQDRRVPQQAIQQPYQGQRSAGQQPPEYDQQQQQQYQYMLQQQQQQRAIGGAYPPTGYIPGRMQQEPQGPGLFSKLKTSLFAAGNAISDSLALSSLDGTPVNTPQQGQGFYDYPPSTAARGQAYPPQRPYPDTPATPYDATTATSNNHYSTMSGARGDARFIPRSALPPQPQQTGLMGRFKSIFGLDDASISDTNSGYGRGVFPNAPLSSGGRPLPPHLMQQQAQSGGYPPYPAYTSGNIGSGGVSSGNSGVQDGYYSSSDSTYEPPSAETISSGLDSPSTTTLPAVFPYTTPTTTTTSTTPTTTAASTLHTPPEPQVFIHEGSIVMILKPREFARKKAAFTAGGADALQVFSDFEHVLTSFTTQQQSQQQSQSLQSERTLTSAELLELSGAVSERALQQLSALAEEFESSGDNVEHGAFESLSARCQAVLCKEGQVKMSSVGVVTRALSPRLGLRQGWSEALHLLADSGVPAYLFSSGYGDVVAAALLQGLYPSASPSTTTSTPGSGAPPQPLPLPQNLRVISNFFRAAPDGTVKAFSQPIVHERNKNATTAAAHMGMEVLSRPHALVLGAHEDDVHMTQGVDGLEEQLSVGYLELTEDLTLRLPVYLSTFDAVVIGDGNFEFIRSLLEDVLQLPRKGSKGGSGATSSLGSGLGSGLGSVSSAGQGIALGLRNRIGALLNSATGPQSPPQTHTQSYAQHSQPQSHSQSQYASVPAPASPQQYGGYSNQPQQQGQYNNPAPRAAHYPPHQQHNQQQQPNQHYNANTAATVSSGVGSGSAGNSGGGNSGGSNGEAVKSPSYLDFNEYQ